MQHRASSAEEVRTKILKHQGGRVEWVEDMEQEPGKIFQPTFFLLIIQKKFFNISL